MVAREVLEVGVQDLVARPHHDRGTQLHWASPGLLLPMSAGERSDSGGDGSWLDERRHAKGLRTDDLGGVAVLVEKHGEGDPFVVDERLGVSTASRSDGGDPGAGGKDLVVSVADLTGPLTACKSTEVAEEENNLRVFRPQVAESLLGPVGIDENLVGELGRVEGHGGGAPGVRYWVISHQDYGSALSIGSHNHRTKAAPLASG